MCRVAGIALVTACGLPCSSLVRATPPAHGKLKVFGGSLAFFLLPAMVGFQRRPNPAFANCDSLEMKSWRSKNPLAQFEFYDPIR
mgnify:CR=1 FL=1